jgi:hypothetical protein
MKQDSAVPAGPRFPCKPDDSSREGGKTVAKKSKKSKKDSKSKKSKK